MKTPTKKQAEKIRLEVMRYFADSGLEVNPTIETHVPYRGITSAKITCDSNNGFTNWTRLFEIYVGKKCFFQHGCRVHAFTSNVLLVWALEDGN